MRIFWLLATGAGLLAVAAISIFIALHSGGNPGTALAITPTPLPEERAWRFFVRVPEEPVAGDIVLVTAEVFLLNSTVFPPGVIDDVSYRIIVNAPELELLSPSSVPVDDILDGAEWEFQALRGGEAPIRVRVSFQVTRCDECAPFSKWFDIGRRVIDVAALPGDVDCNLVAGVIDAALILQFTASIIGELPCHDAADVNRNGWVNPLDATIILQFAAGLLDTLTLDF